MGYTIAIAALTAVAGVLAVVLWRTLAARVGERSAAEEALAAERAAAERLRGEVADERIARVRVESELAALREREQTSRRDREELERTMTAQFRSLAGEIFGEQSREFRRTNRESLDMLLKPFKDNITEFRERVERIYASENEQRGALKNELDNLMRLNVRMTAEATNLTNALRGNSKTQGDWGEVYLETILSSTGLVKGLHYDVQTNLKDETGRNLRPDVLLRLPEERSIVIDSKVSLTAYVNFTAAETEEERRRLMSEHVASVRRHVQELSAKEYQKLVCSPDFVIMFVPSEPAFLEALKQDRAIWSDAYRQGHNIFAHQPLRAVENGRRHVASRCAEQESGGDRRQGHEALRAVGGLYRVVGGCRYGVGSGAHALRRRLQAAAYGQQQYRPSGRAAAASGAADQEAAVGACARIIRG